jgi:hypothetical protein
MSEYINESIIDDTALRPHLYDEEVHVSAPAISVIGSYSLPTTLSSGYIDQGSTPSPSIPKTSFSQRTAYIPPNDPVLFSIPESGPVSSGGLRDPDIWYNSDTLIFQPNGTGGGGGSQSLSQVLAIGNSVGAYDIDMNGQQLLSLAQIQAKPGTDFNIINTTNDVNLAGANITLTSGAALNVDATTMNMGTSKIINLGTPTLGTDAATKAYVDTTAGSSASNWSSYPAKTAVDISGKDLNNVELITGLPAGNNPITINNSYNLGNTLPQHALVVAGGFNTIGLEAKPVAVAIKKETLYAGAGDEELGNVNFYGLDDVGDEQLYANIKTFVQNNTKAVVDSKMTLGVYTNGAVNNLIEIDGSNNKVKLISLLDMSNNKIINLATPTDSTDAATKAYVDSTAGAGAANWATYKAVQNVDMSSNKIINLATPTASTDAATKAYVDVSGGASWSSYKATQNVDMSSNKIINLLAPTASTDAANKAYVDASGGLNWSLYRAVQNVDMSGFDLSGVTNIRGSTAAAGKVTFPAGTIDMCGNAATLALGQNLIYNRVTAVGSNPAGMSVNDPFTAGDANQTAYHFATLTTAITSCIFTMCRKGAFTNMFGVQGTGANNTFVFASQATSTDFEFRRNVGIAPANLTGGTLLGKLDRNGAFSLPLLGTGTTANVLYFNTTNGLITYGAAPSGGSQSLAQVLAVGNTAGTNIDMSLNSITRVSNMTNTSGTLNITADDLNLSATGVTSVLNIGSTFGTLLSSVGAIDITAGGLTTINSTGNISIGSLGTTSIENFNLTNSVLTKVPATADLELNNISKITNAGGNIDISATSVNIDNFSMNGSVLTKVTGATDLQLNNISRVFNNTGAIDISATQVNVESFQFIANNLSAPGATRLFLDDVEAVNNDAVGGRIDITADTIRANGFEFVSNTMNATSTDLVLNNIGTLNNTTEGSIITSKATILANQTTFLDPVGIKTQISAPAGGNDAIGVYAFNTTANNAGNTAVGVYVAGTEANNTNGNAVGLSVQTILGGLSAGNTATGVEVWGSMTGTTKRGFWEHSSSANVVNTFVHPVGIGGDPNSSYLLDVSGGNVRIANTAANPTSLVLENVESGAQGNVLRIYKNSATPANNDIVGNIQFTGNNASLASHTYASIQGAIQNTTAGAEDGEMRLRATINSTSTDFIHIDGSNSILSINPNGASINFNVEDNASRNLIYADASESNVMFRNYPQRYIYDICNNYTLTLPNNFNVMRIVAFGAGGGGGSGRKAPSSAYGGGAGAGGNGVELWYDRRELYSDATGSITLYITPGQGGAGGAGVQTLSTNGNNGSAGGTTYVNLDAFGAAATQKLIPDTATAGGNGGSGGTGAAGTGGSPPTFASDRNIGSQGRSGASSSITSIPVRNTTALLYNGSCYSQTGGSGAGGGIDATGALQFAGGIFVSPCGQKYNGLGANVNKGGAQGTSGGTPGGAGGIVTFDNITSAAVKPLAGMCSLMAGGGASIGGNGGAGGGWTYGVAGSRGDGGGGGGATGNASTPFSGAGGRGADGCVIITIW